MSKRFAIILAVILVAFGTIFFFTKNRAGAPSGGDGNSTQTTNHIKGSTASGVVLLEYADFQCPACAQLYPVVSQVYEKYKDKIQFQFMHFPLYQIHQNAMAAHRAAEAASVQGKFWEMYDTLYARHSEWQSSSTPTVIFEGYANQLGLDVEKFKTDSASSAVNDTIWADINKGTSLKVSGTPTFFLDGKKIETQTTVEDFSKLIDEAIAQKSSAQ